MDNLNKNYYIVQHNSLIAKKKYLTLDEQKIILIFASLIKAKDEDFKTYEVPANEIMKLLDVKNQSKYLTLRDTIYSLSSKPIKIENKNGFRVQPWFSYAEYTDGILKVEFDKRLKKDLLELKEYFTKYKLKNVLYMKSKYSIQMYELLQSNSFKNNLVLEIKELREFLHLENKYTAYKDLKRRILKKAQKELNEKTDISFEFEEIKTGRKVTSLKFHIKSSQNNKALKEVSMTSVDSNYINEVKELFHEKISDVEAKQIFEAAKGNIDLIREKYEIAKKSNNIKNLVGWIIDSLKCDYKEPIEKRKLDNFNNYKQREYDFEDLEKKLLGWI